MAASVRSRNISVLDNRIDLFCQTSAELLAGIHARYGGMADAILPEKKRKKRAKKKAPDQDEE